MSPRTAARIDQNQHAIVKALRWKGATVQHLHMVGRGCPDLLIGYRGRNLLFEIKADGGKLTVDEEEWHTCWAGTVHVIRSKDEALDVLEAIDHAQP